MEFTSAYMSEDYALKNKEIDILTERGQARYLYGTLIPGSPTLVIVWLQVPYSLVQT